MEEKENLITRIGIGKNIRTAVVVIALIFIPIAVGLLAQDQSRRNNNSESDVLAANEVNDIIEKLGQLMELPNEEPTIATISDVDKLTDQQFFSKAQNGDKVIIFPIAQKAILYRPATDKIIEIALYTPPTGVPEQESAVNSEPSPRSLQDLIGDVSPTPEPSISPEPTTSVTPAITP